MSSREPRSHSSPRGIEGEASRTIELRSEDASRKRARRESTEAGGPLQTLGASTRLLRKTAVTIDRAAIELTALNKLVKDNTNTKKEIKEGIARLTSIMSIITTAAVKAVLKEGVIAEQGDNPVGRVLEFVSDQSDVREEVRTLKGGIGEILAKMANLEKAVEGVQSASRVASAEKAAERPANTRRTVAQVVAAQVVAAPPQNAKGAHYDKTPADNNPQGIMNKQTGRLRPRPVRIMVEASEATYGDVLRSVKDGVGPDLGKDVKNARRSKAGNLVIELARSDNEQALITAMRKVVGEEKAMVTRGSIEVIEVRGLEEDTTAPQVVAQAEEVTGRKERYKVREIRRYGRDIRVALVECRHDDAVALLEKGHLRLGWSSCPVQVRPKRLITCAKCLDFGHRAEKCVGPDRANRCGRCGETGHKQGTCEADPSCILCKEAKKNSAHFRGGRDCEAYKLAQAKQPTGEHAQ